MGMRGERELRKNDTVMTPPHTHTHTPSHLAFWLAEETLALTSLIQVWKWIMIPVSCKGKLGSFLCNPGPFETALHQPNSRNYYVYTNYEQNYFSKLFANTAVSKNKESKTVFNMLNANNFDQFRLGFMVPFTDIGLLWWLLKLKKEVCTQNKVQQTWPFVFWNLMNRLIVIRFAQGFYCQNTDLLWVIVSCHEES